MLTVEQIKQTAADAAQGNRRAIALFRELCIAVGIVGAAGGWIKLPGASKPIGHGWRAAAAFVADALTPRAGALLVEMSKASCSPADIALDFAEALTMNESLLCDCDGTHAPTPGGHSVACRQRETLDLFGEPTLDEQHAEALLMNDPRRWATEGTEYPARRPDNRGLRMGPGHVAPATIATAYDEALAEDAGREALAICAGIPIDGRPAAVTELLSAAELLTDEHEHLAAVRHARAVYDELTSTTIVITFDRVGARRYGDALRLEVSRTLLAVPDDVAAVVYRHARRYVVSKGFDVEVDVERGVVLIEGGRFGRGSFPTAMPTPAPEPARSDYYAQFPQPRADRLAEIFAAFVEHADSGGPGTSRGLVAAAELATTVTERQLAQAIVLAGIPKSAGAAYDVSRVLAHLGFDVK